MVRLGVPLVLAVSGCVAAGNLETYRPKSPEEAQIVSVLLKIPRGLDSKSLELVMQPYADDLYVGNLHKYLRVSGPTALVSGSKADMRAVYREMFRDFQEFSLDVKNFRLTVSGDRAVAEARTELLYKTGGGRREKKEDVLRNDVLWRLRNTPLGWKIVEQIFQ